ncbi:MAG: hypothetical protein AAFZ04_15305 [Pseudomonadota bacterium]
MTSPDPKKDDRFPPLEAPHAPKPKRVFPTATVLALLPVGFGLYQFHLSNEFKQEDTQTRALLTALQGDSPSAICGNLSLLVEGGLVTDERLVATQALIDEITQKDLQEVDGGVGGFDCLPRIAVDDDSTVAPVDTDDVSLADRLAAPSACFYDTVELEMTPQADPELISAITGYLEGQDITFAAIARDGSAVQVEEYSGQIWYYSIEARRCAKDLSQGLALLGIDLKPRYYTREDLPPDLPIRIWPNI